MSYNPSDSSCDLENDDISEVHLQLLQSLVRENKELRREQLRQGKVLGDLNVTIKQFPQLADGSFSSQEKSRKRRRSSKVSVPRNCSKEYRRFYKVLKSGNENFNGYDMTISFNSKENREVVETVVKEVIGDQGGKDSCPWTPAQLRAAGEVYFKSSKDAYQRNKKKLSAAHSQTCRRQGRLREKLQRRIYALNGLSVSKEKKEKAAEVLSKEYMSSDESDTSEDESGNVIVSGYLVKKLPWEGQALTNLKNNLDLAHVNCLSSRARHALLPRKKQGILSSRPIPENAPSWAVNASFLHSTPV